MDVYFEGFFGNSENQKKPEKEIPVNKLFLWDNDRWNILSIYEFKEGLTMDFCKEINPGELQEFQKEWEKEISQYEDGEIEIPEELFEQLQEENPGVCDITPKMYLHGRELISRGGSSICYYPVSVFSENEGACPNDPKAEEIIREYGMNPDMGYVIFRWSFTWNKGWRRKREYSLSDIELTMEAGRVNRVGEVFHLEYEQKEEYCSFMNPVNHKEYMITFGTPEQKKMSEKLLNKMDGRFRYPTCYEIIGYKIIPKLPSEEYFIRSRVKGDAPELIAGDDAAAGISVIGGADGPTSIFLAGKIRKSTYYEKRINSPLFFEPTEVRDYEIVFRVKPKEDIHINLEP